MITLQKMKGVGSAGELGVRFYTQWPAKDSQRGKGTKEKTSKQWAEQVQRP